MELFRLFGTIAIDNTEANNGIDETTEKAESAQPKISSAFTKIGTAAVKVGKTIATGLAAGSAAIGALAKQSLDSYADYEQLIGGVETLYGAKYQTLQEYIEGTGADIEYAEQSFAEYQKREQQVLENASNAYKTAGMSANEYMETVNGFAASLTSSLGEYEWQAANYADMIVTDMADNANKMGTSMESIQNAYSGFAKQNYTMLDNLKLGYGGTKEEMERLLRDAEKYAGYIEGSLSIESFADIADAIHIVQEEMGITGTTAKEASQTISGSLASTKSAWQNLLTGFADENQDLGGLIQNLMGSALTAANNIVPRIVQILSGISDALPQIMSVISAELPGLLESLLPGVISGAMSLMTGLISMLPQILAILIEQLPGIIVQLSSALVSVFPVLLQTVKDLFGEIWDYIAVELLGTEADFESSLGKMQEIFTEIWDELQQVWESIGQPIWDLIQKCVGIVRDAFSEKMPEIKEFVSACFQDIRDFWNNNLKPCFEAIGNFIKNVLAPVFEAVFETQIKGRIEDVFNDIKNLWNNTLKPVFTGITDFLTGVFTGNWKKAWNGIVNVFKGIFNIIPTAVESAINGAISVVNGLIKGINKISGKIGLGEISLISKVSLPKLEKGGILEKGQVGLLEGNGAEAVVPLDKNQAWISAVAKDMNAAGIGGQNDVLASYFQQLIDMLADYFPQVIEAAGHDIVTNDGTVVAHYAPLFNKELGRISARKDRGR